MQRKTVRAGLLGAAALAVLTAGTIAPIAGAQTITDVYPETPKLNPALPIINTAHGSDHLKANILNPHPVCNSSEDFRTVVYKITDDFTPVGTVSTTNQTSKPIPLTQKTSRQQTISLKVNGSVTEKTDVNLGGNGSKDGVGGQAGIAYSLTKQIGAEASYSLSWSVGQDIGPYEIQPGHTGEATYGFRTVSMTGTQQFCLADGTWSHPMPWNAMVPLKNEVVVKQYDNPAGSFGGTTPSATTTPATSAPMTSAPATSAPATTTVPTSTPAGEKYDDVAAPTAPTGTKNELDLQPFYTVSPMKSPGYAGTVAVRVKNVGTKRYFQDRLATSFRIDVHTAKGPEGVDRLITPQFFNGAYVRDLGFDEARSVRSFEVTLSNPLYVGDDQLLATLNFGDGDTREGRIVNYIEVTQVGRAAGDTSTANDQNVDSRKTTKDDFGRAHSGLF